MTSKKTSTRTQFIEHSAVFLPDDSPIFRKPRFGWKKREDNFNDGFEKTALFYDVFWHDDGKQILLLGPPPRNLMPLYKKAKYKIDGDEKTFSPKFFITQSVMIISLQDIPKNAKILNIDFNGLKFSLKIQKNYSSELAKKRIIFTISKDNPVHWITAWADYYQQFHGANALILVDNGSTKTNLKQVAKALETTKIKDIYIVSWPYIFGAIDGSVIFNPFWTNFLQNAFNSLVLRRFGAQAEGLLNCDIDELATHKSEKTIFDALKKTKNGLLAMNGSWVEANKLNEHIDNHRAFGYQLIDEKSRICKARKWALDPKQTWVQNLNIHPYWHWIENRPNGVKTMDKDAFFWHFKGINNNWKVDRNIVSKNLPNNIELDKELISTMSLWAKKQKQNQDKPK